MVFLYLFLSIFNNQECNKARVIAVDGLNVRAEPSLQADIITSLPYLSLVDIIEKTDKWYQLDELCHWYYLNDMHCFKLHGEWVLIQYGDIKGYVISCYIMCHYEDGDKKVKEGNYSIQLPIANCADNFSRTKRTWYGVYEGEFDFVKEIDIHQCVVTNRNPQSDMFGYRDNFTYTDDMEGLRFMIGIADGTIREGEVESQWMFKKRNLSEQDHLGEQYNGEELQFDENRNLYTTNSDTKVELISEYLATQLFWMGDLDKDGYLDYLIGFGEKDMQICLFLSSHVNDKGELHSVALYLRPWCC